MATIEIVGVNPTIIQVVLPYDGWNASGYNGGSTNYRGEITCLIEGAGVDPVSQYEPANNRPWIYYYPFKEGTHQDVMRELVGNTIYAQIRMACHDALGRPIELPHFRAEIEVDPDECNQAVGRLLAKPSEPLSATA